MKSLKHISIVLIVIFFTHDVRSQWLPCQGLEGGRTGSIFSSDSMLLTSTYAEGIYRSDLQTPWEVNETYGIGEIFKAGNCLFAYTWYNLYRSTDNGMNWEDVLSIDSRTVCAVDSTIFLHYYGNIARTNNQIDSIEILYNAPDVYYPAILSYDSLLLLIDDDNMKIYQSVDMGESWDSITTNGIQFNQYWNLFSLCCFSNTIWLGGGMGCYYLNENKDEWIKVPDPFDVFYISKIHPSEGSLIAGGNFYGLYELNLNPYSWSLKKQTTFIIIDICTHNNLTCLSTDDGPYLFDSLNNLTPFFDGLNHRYVTSLSTVHDSIYVIADEYLYKSIDMGDNFSRLAPYDVTQVICSDTIQMLLYDSGIIISHDDFITLDTINADFDHQFLKFTYSENYIYAIVSNRGCMRTAFDTVSWDTITNDLGGVFYDVAVLDSVVLACDKTNQGAYLSLDHGNSFTKIFDIQGTGKPGVFAIDSLLCLCTGDSIIYSSDHGHTWSIIIADGGNYGIEEIDLSVNNIFYAWNSINYMQVKISNDWGENWTEISDNLPHTFYFNLPLVSILEDRLLISSSSYGLWYRDDMLTGLDQEQDVPLNTPAYTLYPNPAETSINITPETNSEFAIYSINGKLFKTGIIKSTSNLNISDLPSGIYILRITNEQETSNLKFIKY